MKARGCQVSKLEQTIQGQETIRSQTLPFLLSLRRPGLQKTTLYLRAPGVTFFHQQITEDLREILSY